MDLPIPPNFQVGCAEEGDSFFDSIAKCLHLITPLVNVKSLRKICAKYAKERDAQQWFTEALLTSKQSFDQYAKNVQYCAEDFQQVTVAVRLESPMRGRPEIEGRIICAEFGVHLHVLEKHVRESGDTNWINRIISYDPNCNGLQPTYGDPKQIHIIDLGDLHFQPILRRPGESALLDCRQQTKADIVTADRSPGESSNSEPSDVKKTMHCAKIMPRESRRPLQGTGGDKGQIYEIKLTILIYLRAQTLSHGFFLQREVSKAGKLDDLVLKYYKNATNLTDKRESGIFLQIKHRMNTETDGINPSNLLENEGYYSAAEYFRSYLEIKKTYLKNNHDNINRNFDNCNFVIYTNAGYHAAETNIAVKRNETDFSSILVSKETGEILQLQEMSKKLRSAVGTKRLAQVIYKYAYGNKKGEPVRSQEKILYDYQIPLASYVFEISRDKPGEYKFQGDFLKESGCPEAKMLWKELSAINDAGKNPQNLGKAHFKFFKGFGVTSFNLCHQNRNLAQSLAEKINKSESKHVIINEKEIETVTGINMLAQNILVSDERVNDGYEWVKFKELKTLPGMTAEFMKDLTECIDAKCDLQEYSFLISGFPRLSLPKPHDDANDEDIDGFLKHFYMFVGQSNERELDDIIKSEIQNTYGVNVPQSITIFSKAHQYVQNWRNHANALRENNNFIVDEISKINCDQFPLRIQGFDIQFDSRKILRLTDPLRQNSVLSIIANKGTKQLSVIRVIHAMHEQGCCWAFVKWDQLKKANLQVLKSFYWKDYLIVCDGCNVDYEIVFRNLAEIMNSNSKKKVIAITELGECEIDLRKYCTVRREYDEGIFKGMTRELQDKILLGRVTFQGARAQLGDLFNLDDIDAENVIGSETLLRILNNDDIIVGQQLQRLGDLEAACVKMYTAIPVTNLVDGLLRNSRHKSICMFHGVGKQQDQSMDDVFVRNLQIQGGTARAEEIKKRIATEEILIYQKKGESEILKIFKQLCKHERKTIYLLHLHGEEFILQQIHDPQFYMKRKICHPHIVRVNIDALVQTNMTANFIIEGQANEEQIMNIMQNYYPKQYDIRCMQGNIIFVEDKDAQDKFDNLCENRGSVEWIKVDEMSKDHFILVRTYGPSPILHKGNIIQPDDLIKDTTFLISGNVNKVIVGQMLQDCVDKKIQSFQQNCCNGNISFSPKRNEAAMANKQSHWLSINGDVLTWIRSNSTLESLRDFAIKELDVMNENEFSKMAKSKCVIIADDPGMGKSTTLTSFLEQMLETNWVLRVDFRECVGAIKQLPSINERQDFTFQDVYDFFSRVNSTGLQSDLEKRLFAHKLQQKTTENRPIIILFDAFDEISNEHQQKIIVLLKFLKVKSLAKLWITTRRNRVEVLEDALSTFASNIEELTEIQQQDFLFNFWSVCMKLYQKDFENILIKYVKSLIEKSTEVLGEKMLHFMGVPLQLRLLAEGLKNEVSDYCKSEHYSVLKIDSLDILSMYQKFIKQKYNIFFLEKIQLADPNAYITEKMSKCFNKDHRNLAWTMLFPKEKMPNDSCTLISKEHESCLQSVGIIQSQGSDGITYFIHRTFAEYFVADFIVDNLGKSRKKFRLTIQFLIKNMFPGDNIVIRRFIDQMLSEKLPILVAVLKGDLKKLLELLNGNNKEMVVDKLGRTALHLAAQEGHLNIVKFLLDSGYSALKTDSFGKTCLHYATMNGHENVVDHLTNYIADIDIHDNICSETLNMDQDIGDNIFTKAKLLSSNLVTLVNYLDIDGDSSLRYAATNQHWGIACSLIVNGAYTSCLTADHQRKIYSYAIGRSESVQPWSNRLFPVIGLLLMKFPTIFSITGECERQHHENKCYCDKATFVTFVNTENAAKENDNTDYSIYLTNNYGQTSLHSAAKYDFNEVKYLVSNGANVNIADKNGKTALDYALDYDRKCDAWQMKDMANIVRYLITECNAKSALNSYDLILATEIVTTGKLTLLHDAVTLPTTFFAHYLIHLGADINMRDLDGKTPLHNAALTSREESKRMIEFLLEEGAMYNLKDKMNKTVLDYIDPECDVYPLMADVDEFFKDVSMLNEDVFLSNNACAIFNACNENGDTLLHISIREQPGHETSRIIYACTSSKVKCLSAINNHGNTLLHLAAAVGDYETFIALLSGRVVINSTNYEGFTPLEIARDKQHFHIADMLEKYENAFNAAKTGTPDEFENAIPFPYRMAVKNNDGKTLLHFIAEYGYNSMMKYYYPYHDFRGRFHGDYHQHRDSNGCTPLHYAAENDHTHMVYELLKFGAAYNPKNNKGKRPIDLAKSEALIFLKSVHIIFELAQNDNLRAFTDRLVSFKYDAKTLSAVINSMDSMGNTILNLFARRRNFEAVKFLLQTGAPYNVGYSVRVYGERIESLICMHDSLFDWENGFKYKLNEENVHQIVNARDIYGKTILHHAHRKEIDYYKLNYLVNHGADVNATCKFGTKVMDIANVSNLDVTKYFLLKGATICETNASIIERFKQFCKEKGRPDIAVLVDRFHQTLRDVK